LIIWPEYHSAPSRVASGSWGLEPGVGSGQDLIEMRVGPGSTTPAGLVFSG
jgi:hypothetical protein